MCGDQQAGPDGNVLAPSTYRVAVAAFYMGMCLSFSPSLFSLPFVAVDRCTDHIRLKRGIQDLEDHEEWLRPPRQQQRTRPDAALISVRCRLRPARLVTRLPAGCHAGVNAGQRRVFSSRVACTLPAPHNDGSTSDGTRARGIRGHSIALLRCNFLPQARDIIVNRPAGLSSCVRRAVRPCTVRRRGYYAPEAPTTLYHTMCHPVSVSTGRHPKA